MVVALVTEEGGPTSHTAIVARSLGIPAVVRCAGVLGIEEATTVAVDGTTGAVRVNPDAALVADFQATEERRRVRLAGSHGPGRTADGHPVALLANIGSAADLTGEGGAGAEGVGLFRTELLYLDRATAPNEAEQVAAYRAVFDAAAGRPVVVRTLDAGADKPLAFLSQADEPNPALGVRGLRLGWQQPEVLRTQLAAIAAAARLDWSQRPSDGSDGGHAAGGEAVRHLVSCRGTVHCRGHGRDPVGRAPRLQCCWPKWTSSASVPTT